MSATLIHPGATRGEPALTLTVRGRRLLRTGAAVLAVLAVLIGGRAVAGAPTAPVPVDTYTVSTGETLWEIAAAYTAPHHDVRDTVGALIELNGLDGAALRAGEQILVPLG